MKGLAHFQDVKHQLKSKDVDDRNDLMDISLFEHLENSPDQREFLLDKHKELAPEEPNKETVISIKDYYDLKPEEKLC